MSGEFFSLTPVCRQSAGACRFGNRPDNHPTSHLWPLPDQDGDRENGLQADKQADLHRQHRALSKRMRSGHQRRFLKLCGPQHCPSADPSQNDKHDDGDDDDRWRVADGVDGPLQAISQKGQGGMLVTLTRTSIEPLARRRLRLIKPGTAESMCLQV